jgi:hypothetical protein
VIRFYLKMVLVSLPLAPLLGAIRRLAIGALDTSGIAGCLTVSLLVGAAFAAFLLLAGFGLRIAEITEPVQRGLRAINPRRF